MNDNFTLIYVALVVGCLAFWAGSNYQARQAADRAASARLWELEGNLGRLRAEMEKAATPKEG